MKPCSFWIKACLLTVTAVLFMPTSGKAIPAFARKYGVKCYTCHTVPPALNKNGYMFKRLGYRMPPDEMDGTKPAPKITELDKNNRFDITNVVALLLNGSFTYDSTKADAGNVTSASPSTSCASGTAQTSTCNSFNLDEAALFLAGTVPNTGFSYFAHYEMYQGGSNGLEQGFGVYTGGRANSSYFVKVGEIHMQEGEGTRAAMFYNLFPDPAPTLTDGSPINFSLDQHPVGVDFGYTWAGNYFKNVFAISGKVTNGLNADGSEILDTSTKDSKDFWVDADYWFGPDGGVTAMMYRGTKDQATGDGLGTYSANINRVGVFGNYLFKDKFDVLGGYMHSSDDWKATPTSTIAQYTSNAFRGEADYYVKQGTVIMARYDRITKTIPTNPTMHTQAWAIGAERGLTETGNVVLRANYRQQHDGDPVALTGTTDKLFKVDIRYMW